MEHKVWRVEEAPPIPPHPDHPQPPGTSGVGGAFLVSGAGHAGTEAGDVLIYYLLFSV